MNDKTRFLLKASIVATGLFAVWAPSSHLYSVIRSYALSFISGLLLGEISVDGTIAELPFNQTFAIIPFIALMAATPEMQVAKKLSFIFAGIMIFLGLDLVLRPLVSNTDMLASVVQNIYYLLPFMLWVIFSYSQTSFLWMPNHLRFRSEMHSCPICGVAQDGLIDHVREVHGEKALADMKVRIDPVSG